MSGRDNHERYVRQDSSYSFFFLFQRLSQFFMVSPTKWSGPTVAPWGLWERRAEEDMGLGDNMEKDNEREQVFPSSKMQGQPVI